MTAPAISRELACALAMMGVREAEPPKPAPEPKRPPLAKMKHRGKEDA